MFPAIQGWGRGRATATAGTRIRFLVPGHPNGYTYIDFMRYTAGVTAHTLTLLRGMDYAKAAAPLAAAGTSLVVNKALVDGAGNAIAANDILAIELDNGDWHLSLVTSWTPSTLTIVLTTAIPAGRSVLNGARVVSYGVQSDAGHADFAFTGTASVSSNFPAVGVTSGPICRSKQLNEPIVFDSDNATNAGTMETICASYMRE